MAAYQLPEPDSLALSRRTADKLIASKNGSAALAYLCILRSGSTDPARLASDLVITQGEAEGMLNTLADMGLVQVATEKREYSAKELTAALYNEEFHFLYSKAENLFGEVLSPEDAKRLLYIYDGLNLPPEVILQMMQYYKSEVRKKGPGARMKMSYLEKTAVDWKQRGIVTLEAAEEHLKARELADSLENEIKRALDIFDRKPTAKEREYIDSWVTMGFRPDAIRLCYEKSVNNKGKRVLPYMDAIFLSWHKKGLHTPEEIARGDDQKPAAAEKARPAAGRQDTPDEDEYARMQRFLQSMKGE